jgi:saxitoxin biosynthesis operon SxtJ-like protein
MGFRDEIVSEIKSLRPGPKELRNLGLVFLGAFGLIGGLLWWRGGAAWPWFLAAAGLFGLWGLLWPAGLKGVYKVWLSLAIVLGFFVSRILLTLLFYLVVTPIGLLMRLLGKDLLDQKMGDRDSYWHLRGDEPYDPKRSEKMY